MKENQSRCPWCGTDPLYQKYHDEEWGVPVYEDQKIFEMLTLESAQAGLSWITILRKRENYRLAFAHFDAVLVERFSERQVQQLLKNEGIIRNEAKIRAAIHNARVFLRVQDEFGSFSDYAWRLFDFQPKDNRRKSMTELPAFTEESELFHRDLKKRGFKFLGPTTVYAHMQASGMVNDHLLSCFRYSQV